MYHCLKDYFHTFEMLMIKWGLLKKQDDRMVLYSLIVIGVSKYQ